MYYMKRVISLTVVFVLVLSLLSGCEFSLNPKNLTDKNDARNNNSKYDTFLTVDVFSTQANYQGIQSGWFGKVVEEKFNMKLNIIAPNVAGTGDRLFQTRTAAGNLADIVMISAENGRLAEVVEAGLLLDLSQYMDLMPNAMQYSSAIETMQTLLGIDDKIFAIPSAVSSFSPMTPSESTEPSYGPYLRWDLYMDIGAPKMETLEDLLPVLKKMQINNPLSDNGNKTYAFSLFGDWDNNLMMFAKQPTCFYGYDEVGFTLNKADGTDVVSILDDDSPYIRSLKFYFQANRMGLVDPESRTQNWDDMVKKYEEGAVLFSPWAWLGQPAYNTMERLNAGKGFMMAPIDDLKIFSYGATPKGTKFVVGIGANTEDPQRMIEFVDWLYSPEGIMMSTSQEGSTSGPEGLTWKMVDDRPVLTQFGITAMLDNGTEMPEEWGGGSWGIGTSQLNFSSVIPKDINPNTGYSYDFRLWESYQEFTMTPVHKSWQMFMEASSTLEYLEEKEQYIVAPGTDYFAPAETTEISTLRSKCKAIIVDTSWQMIFATDETEFNRLLDSMQKRVKELGYDTVLAFDVQTATKLNEARAKARE